MAVNRRATVLQSELVDLRQRSEEITEQFNLLTHASGQDLATATIVLDHAGVAINLIHTDEEISHILSIVRWKFCRKFEYSIGDQIFRWKKRLIEPVNTLHADIDEEGTAAVHDLDAFVMDLLIGGIDGEVAPEPDTLF